ncbi:MAG: transcription antiterminator [Sporomusaceae bacterium]|nr:transcription antiterminator [Sporomusaceae bacterium]
MMILNYRCWQLVNKMIDAKAPVLIKDLAQEFGVSERTIKYDLASIRRWLKEQNHPDISLQAKPNRGIWIDGDKAEILHWLTRPLQDSPDVLLSAQERVWYIALQLLLADSYITVRALADAIGVSKNTIAGDLQEAERLLGKWHIHLERKPHRGLRVAALETLRRSALTYAIQSFLSGSDMSHLIGSLIRGHDLPPRIGRVISASLLHYRDVELVYKFVRKIAKKAQDTTDSRLSERTMLSLFVCLCVVIQRIQTNHLLHEPVSCEARSRDHPLFQYFQGECAALADSLKVKLPPNEIQYIWWQCFTVLSGSDDLDESLRSNATLTAQLIAGVSGATGIRFEDDNELFDSLLAHLTSRLAEYQHQIFSPNPAERDVIRAYNQMFQSVKQICDDVLGPLNIHFNNADLAHITLHFQAAYERSRGRCKYKALVVCGTGRSSARLLKVRLENEIRNLFVVSCCSVFELKKALALCPVDLVISVLPIEVDYPLVIVQAIPSKRDIEAIYAVLENIRQDTIADTPLLANGNTFLETLMEMKSGFAPNDLPALEMFSQEIINQGFQIATLITTEFRDFLSEQAAAGLTIHILLMVNRLAFGNPYVNFDLSNEVLSEQAVKHKERLARLLDEHYPGIADSELNTIIRYFS